ncbi:MAG: zinc ribbon domain-containing protein [Sandaracinaceae bacterium]|nr:zinc ribbon domain-containing protein [Sandaracinaceae bacterium]
MADAITHCPTCRTEIPAGAVRCPGCGRVFGEENRCPHCHAIAAVIERRGKTYCAACGKPRVGAVTLRGDKARGSIVPTSRAAREAGTAAMLTRARGRTQRAFGIFALAAGIAAAATVAALVPGGAGIGLALLVGLLGVGAGAFSIRSGARNMERARGIGDEVGREAVRDLAKKKGGVLSAAQTAEALGLSVEDADAVLTSLVGDGSEVDVEIDDQGGVAYVFHELRARGAQVRVETFEPEVEEALEPEADARADRRRGL